MKTYNLHIGNVQLLNEALNDIKKRNILIEGFTIEEVDKLTSLFPSFKEIEEELNQVREQNDAAVIMLLDDYNKGIEITTSDIVYTEDMKQINNRDGIKAWTFDYLRRNPTDVTWFDGIRSAYKNIYGRDDCDYTEDKVVFACNAYFNNAGYSAYRSTYFALKAIDPPIPTNDRAK